MSRPGGSPTSRFDPSRLDDQAYLSDGDPSGMLRTVASAAAQVRTAYRAAVEAGAAAVAGQGRPRALVVAGVGAAGIAGDVLDAVCGPGTPVPVLTVRGYRLPGWVGAADLVMVVSFTGRGDEALAVGAEAVRRGCTLLAAGPPDTPLSALAAQAGAPFVPISTVAGQPRATMWGLAVPLLVAASAFGLADVGEPVFEAAAARLEDIAHRCRPASDSFINPGKTLAMELADGIPVIWGSSPLAAVAAHRLAGRLAEHAGYPAVWGELPEAAHNQAGVFDGPLAVRDIFHDFADDESSGPQARLRLFVLRDTDEHPQVAERRQAAVRLAQDRGVPVSEVASEGDHPFERLATLICLGDFASVYLALGYGLDPAPMSAITELRARISQ
ncbi:SIS domain-containing protein [Microtetraspora sp. NBRC 16547]|uniref:SIS domain-containing protein n=1 Tax=Microtetraspora sp. NBRC 16547 TaxID=3030993 RepID=UPI0024A3646E|nr:SIS domain-containing protein [Microtetraspora sp. NBRC 16547]GLW96018.1 bifunctional glucose-6-phosphate/mannose-6-phosphate isomerase [Microtetraspora sp. NBRC 16547]